jgi:hypothetical protein
LIEWLKSARRECREWSHFFASAPADPAAVEDFWENRQDEWEGVVKRNFDTSARKKLAEVKSKDVRGQILKALVSVPDLTRSLRDNRKDFGATADAMSRIEGALHKLYSATERLKGDFPELVKEEAEEEKAREKELEKEREKAEQAKKSARGGSLAADGGSGRRGAPGASASRGRKPNTLPPPIPARRSSKGGASKGVGAGLERRADVGGDGGDDGEAGPTGEIEPRGGQEIEVSDDQVVAEEHVEEHGGLEARGEARKDAGLDGAGDEEAEPAPAPASGGSQVEIDSVDLTRDADVLDQPVIRLTKKSRQGSGSGSGLIPKDRVEALGDGGEAHRQPQDEAEAKEGATAGEERTAEGAKDGPADAKEVEVDAKGSGDPAGAEAGVGGSSGGARAKAKGDAQEVPTGGGDAEGTPDVGGLEALAPELSYSQKALRAHTGEDARLALLETYLRSLRARGSLSQEQLMVLDHIVTVLGSALPNDRQGVAAKISHLDRLFAASSSESAEAERVNRVEEVIEGLGKRMREEIEEVWGQASPSGLELDISQLAAWDDASQLPVCRLARSLVSGLSRWRLPAGLSSLAGPARGFTVRVNARKGVPLAWPVPENELELGLAGYEDGVLVTAIHLVEPSEESPLGKAATAGMPGAGVLFQIQLPAEAGEKTSAIATRFALTEASRFIRHLGSSRK